jgi:hypothetical protein
MCKGCKFYWPLKKRLKDGKIKALNRGHCLKRSIFPQNKPGNPVYPPDAIIADTAHNLTKAFIVKDTDIVTSCSDYTSK